jgi:hypothetical protein
MVIPFIDPPPNPDFRAEIIANSSNEDLEKIRQHALGTMFALSRGKSKESSDYAVWSTFVEEIEAELRRRWRD